MWGTPCHTEEEKECWGYTPHPFFTKGTKSGGILFIFFTEGTKSVGGTLFISFFTKGTKSVGGTLYLLYREDKECWVHTLLILTP